VGGLFGGGHWEANTQNAKEWGGQNGETVALKGSTVGTLSLAAFSLSFLFFFFSLV
jgi:hypothetical protein